METLESNNLASTNDDKSWSKNTIHNSLIPMFIPLNSSFEDSCKPTSKFSQSISIIMKTPLLVHLVRWRVMEISLWTCQQTMALHYITSFFLISYLMIIIWPCIDELVIIWDLEPLPNTLGYLGWLGCDNHLNIGTYKACQNLTLKHAQAKVDREVSNCR